MFQSIFIHGEGATSLHVWMATIPTRKDGMCPFIRAEIGGNVFHSPQGKLESVVLQQKTIITHSERI